MKFENTGKVMRKLRDQAGLTQAQLANKLGLHSQYVSNAERSACFYPKAKMNKLIKALKIQAADKMEIAKALETDFRKQAQKNYKQFFGY